MRNPKKIGKWLNLLEVQATIIIKSLYHYNPFERIVQLFQHVVVSGFSSSLSVSLKVSSVYADLYSYVLHPYLHVIQENISTAEILNNICFHRFYCQKKDFRENSTEIPGYQFPACNRYVCAANCTKQQKSNI